MCGSLTRLHPNRIPQTPSSQTKVSKITPPVCRSHNARCSFPSRPSTDSTGVPKGPTGTAGRPRSASSPTRPQRLTVLCRPHVLVFILRGLRHVGLSGPPEVGRAESGTDTLAGNRKGRPTRDGHTTPALVPLNRPGMSAMVFPPGISCSIPAEVPRRWPAAPFPVERATSWRSWQILTPALNRVGENENTPRADQPKLITQGVFESPAAS